MIESRVWLRVQNLPDRLVLGLQLGCGFRTRV